MVSAIAQGPVYACDIGKIDPLIEKLEKGEVKGFKKALEGLSTAEKVDDLFKRVIGKSLEQEHLKLLETFLSLISLEEVEKAVKEKFPDIDFDSLKELDMLLKDSIKESKALKRPKEMPYILKSVTGFLDTVAAAFSFFEIGKDPGSSWEASHLLTVYGQAITFPLTIFITLQAVLTPLAAFALTIGVIACCLLFVYLYFHYFQPAPHDIQGSENLVDLAAKQQQQKILGRDHMISEICNVLMSPGEHPLLIGESSVGKTSLIKRLAQKMVEGGVPDSLKGKRLFLINASKLLNQGFDNSDRLEKLLKRIGRHKDKCIICFDEIHAVFSDDYKDTIGNRMLSVLDASSHKDSLPYCIGITTLKNYEDLISKKAIDTRFRKITVESTGHEQTKTILKEVFADQMAAFDITDKMLDSAIENTKHLPQPATARRVVESAIVCLEGSKVSSELLEKQEEQYRACLAKYRADSAQGTVRDVKSYSESLSAIKQRIDQEKKVYEEQTKTVERLKNLRNIKQQVSQSILKMASDASDEGKKKYLFFTAFLKEELKKQMDALIEKLPKDFPSKMTEGLLEDQAKKWTPSTKERE